MSNVTNNKEKNNLCSICLEHMNIYGDISIVEPCKHQFHTNCLNKFKEHSSKKFCVCSYNIFKCPLCRTFLYMTLDDYKYYNPMPYKFCCSTKYLRPFNCIDLVQYT